MESWAQANPPLELDYTWGQLQGARSRQEDSCLLRQCSGGLIALVADGLGGHPAGDAASCAGIQRTGSFLADWLEQQQAPGGTAPLREAFLAGDAAVRQLFLPEEHQRPPATTLVGGVFCPLAHRFDAANLGDSVALLLRNGKLTALFEPQGRGNCVDFALGTGTVGDIRAAVTILRGGLYLRGGDRIVLASDGIEVLTPEAIRTAMSLATARQTVDRLIAAVTDLYEPTQDNCSVAVIHVRD